MDAFVLWQWPKVQHASGCAVTNVLSHHPYPAPHRPCHEPAVGRFSGPDWWSGWWLKCLQTHSQLLDCPYQCLWLWKWPLNQLLFLANVLAEKMPPKPAGRVDTPFLDKPQSLPIPINPHHPIFLSCTHFHRKKKGSAQSPQNITSRHPLWVNSHLRSKICSRSWLLDPRTWPRKKTWSLKYHKLLEMESTKSKNYIYI